MLPTLINASCEVIMERSRVSCKDAPSFLGNLGSMIHDNCPQENKTSASSSR